MIRGVLESDPTRVIEVSDGDPILCRADFHLLAPERAAAQSAELREFMLTVRRALLLIVAYIDRRYNLSKS